MMAAPDYALVCVFAVMLGVGYYFAGCEEHEGLLCRRQFAPWWLRDRFPIG